MGRGGFKIILQFIPSDALNDLSGGLVMKEEKPPIAKSLIKFAMPNVIDDVRIELLQRGDDLRMGCLTVKIEIDPVMTQRTPSQCVAAIKDRREWAHFRRDS